MNRLERIKGCLLGGAVGDALGAPVEFLEWTAIEAKFGPQGIVDFAPAYGITGATLASQVCGYSGLPSCASVLPQVPRKMPVSLRVGDSDSVLNWVRADRNYFLAAGWISGSTLDYAEFTGGHYVDTASLPAVWQFFCPWQRLP